MTINIRQKMIGLVIILFCLYLPLSAQVNQSTLSIEPSRASYTTIRYQVGEELTRNWNVVTDTTTPTLVTIENDNLTLFVQESKDGKKWTKVTPFEFDATSATWEAGRKFSYTPPESTTQLEATSSTQKKMGLAETLSNAKDSSASTTITIKSKNATKVTTGYAIEPIDLEVGENLVTVVVTEEGKIPQKYTFMITRKGETPAVPLITPYGGDVVSNTSIRMKSSEGASIYYTTDGTTPTTSSRLYNDASPITYNGPDEITIKAIAVKEGSNDSAVSSMTYRQSLSRLSSLPFDNAPLNYSFNPEVFNYPVRVVEHSVSSLKATSSPSISITVNDKNISSNVIDLDSGDNTIKVVTSEVGKISQEYTFMVRRKGETPSTPVVYPRTKTILSGTEITIASRGADTIYYTTDNSNPASSSTRIEYTAPYTYEGPNNITLKAIAVREGSNDSEITSAVYSQAVSRLSSLPFNNEPTNYAFSPEVFNYSRATVEYGVSSLAASAPSNVSISVNNKDVSSSTIDLATGNNTIKVVAHEDGKIPQEYTFMITRKGKTPASPTFSPANEIIVANTPIMMNSSDDATIYYTIDGTNPTASSRRYNPSSPFVYSGPNRITLKAIAVKEGSNNSEVSIAVYGQAVSRLSSIPFDNSLLDYSFNPEVFNYPARTVEYSVSSLNTTSSDVTITVNGKIVTSRTIDLVPGDNTISAITNENGKVPQEYIFIVTRKGETPLTPTFIPQDEIILANTRIIMSSSDGSSIYYTKDNSDPKTSSERVLYNSNSPYMYEGPERVTIKAVAVKKGSNDSEVSSTSYRQAESRLESLEFNNAPVNYNFDPETFDYGNLVVENDVSSLAVSALPSMYAKDGAAMTTEATTIKDDITYLAIQPSKSSFTTIRYQVGKSVGANWTVVTGVKEPLILELEDKTSTLYVQESKDGRVWTDIIPYIYEETSGTWAAQKKIPSAK